MKEGYLGIETITLNEFEPINILHSIHASQHIQNTVVDFLMNSI